LYGEWLFERREFDQSALGMGDIKAPHLCSLTGYSIYGRAETTESNACIRKSAVMARTLRSRAASEGRSRGNRCDGIPCGRYALLPQLATLVLTIALQRIWARRSATQKRVKCFWIMPRMSAKPSLSSSREINSRKRVVS
jgi:hypothetical protein